MHFNLRFNLHIDFPFQFTFQLIFQFTFQLAFQFTCQFTFQFTFPFTYQFTFQLARQNDLSIHISMYIPLYISVYIASVHFYLHLNLHFNLHFNKSWSSKLLNFENQTIHKYLKFDVMEIYFLIVTLPKTKTKNERLWNDQLIYHILKKIRKVRQKHIPTPPTIISGFITFKKCQTYKISVSVSNVQK